MKTLTLLFAIACAACATTPCVVDAKPCPTPKPTPTCATACANGSKLSCTWAAPTPQGHTCPEVCTNAAQTVPWNVTSLTNATSCTP